MKVFAAFYGEYDMPGPIGIYEDLETAKQKLVESNPTYNTDVCEYDTKTGLIERTWYYLVRTKEWEEIPFNELKRI